MSEFPNRQAFSGTDASAPASHLSAYERPVSASVSSCRAVIASVEEGSPAWEAGLEPGMVATEVEGVPLEDIIEWRWQSDGFSVELTLDDGETALLERDLGQDWGIEFTDVLFDQLLTCRNNCSFCFMRMLPHEARTSLFERDDDYRLSFLQGNFVTLTNLTEAQFQRIVDYGLSPLHVSVHAISDDVRAQLMGRNAGHGKEMLTRLLEAGIEVHAQLVLVPGVNDGIELTNTLSWLEAWPNVLSVGIVPLGYTKFQDRFTWSYSDNPELAREVVDIVREFQEDSRNDTRVTRYHLSDEFYLDAHLDFPPAWFYDGMPMYYDGIGMMRTFIDDWEASKAEIAEIAQARAGLPKATIVVGEAFGRVLGRLLAHSPLAQVVTMLPVKNNYYGGNVDVTGLLTATDIIPALNAVKPQGLVILPDCIFNADHVMLDDSTLEDIRTGTGTAPVICTYNVSPILQALR